MLARIRRGTSSLSFGAIVAGTSLLVPNLLTAQTPAPSATADSTPATPPATLDEISVTSGRERAVPPPVATVDVAPEVLRRQPARNAYDMVRRAAGVEVHEQGQGPGFASDAVIRGFTSDHSSDVLLVIDGVPINLPIHGHVEGYADWSILSPAAVSALRVIHGPASPLYGDFAVGGVVEVFTAADASGTAGGASATSYGDVGGWTRFGQRAARGGWLAAIDGTRQQGWRQNDSYWLGNAVLRGWRSVGRGRLEGGFMSYGSNWDSPGFVSVARYNAGDLKAATDLTDGGSARRFIGQLRYGLPLGANTSLDVSTWGQLARSTVYLNIPDEDEVAQSDEEDRRHAVGGQMQLNWTHGGGAVTFGLSGRADWADYSRYHTAARVRTDAEQSNDGHYQAGGGFVRWRGLLGNHLVYDVGGRLDAVHYASLDRLDTAPGWQSATHVIASPKIGARYLLNGNVALLGSLSRGFRGPIGVIAEPDRPTTVTWAKELGAAYLGERLDLQVALFQQDVAHERILDPVTRDVVDAGRSRRRGVSLDGGVAVTGRFRLTGELTLNNAKVKPLLTSSTLVVPPGVMSARIAGPVPEPGAAPIRPSFHDVPLPPGATVPGVADYLGRAGFETDLTSRLAARGLVRFSGPYMPIGEQDARTQAYAVGDAGVSVKVGAAGGTLDVDLLNVLDTKYPELRASGYLNPGLPRTLRIGMRFDGGR